MPKKVALQDRNLAPVMFLVPFRVKEQLDQIVNREHSSISEVGRRLVTKYLERQKAGAST
jgi:uncharacterized protein YceH (UPF0502 family)